MTSLTLSRLNVGVREFLVVFCRPQTVGARDQRASKIFEDPTKSPFPPEERPFQKESHLPKHHIFWVAMLICRVFLCHFSKKSRPMSGGLPSHFSPFFIATRKNVATTDVLEARSGRCEKEEPSEKEVSEKLSLTKI